MANPVKFRSASKSSTGRPMKSVAPLISAALGLTTAPQDFATYLLNGSSAKDGGGRVTTGAWIDIGDAPGIDVLVKYTHVTTPAVVTLMPMFANPSDATTDPTVYAPPPSIAAADITAGVGVAYPAAVSFSKNNWTTTTSPGSSSSVKYARAYIYANGCRLVKIMGFADSATGSPTCIIEVSLGTPAA